MTRERLQRLGLKSLFIELESPWANGYIEPFNGSLRDELLNGDIFDRMLETQEA
jgi:putative transposase